MGIVYRFDVKHTTVLSQRNRAATLSGAAVVGVLAIILLMSWASGTAPLAVSGFGPPDPATASVLLMISAGLLARRKERLHMSTALGVAVAVIGLFALAGIVSGGLVNVDAPFRVLARRWGLPRPGHMGLASSLATALLGGTLAAGPRMFASRFRSVLLAGAIFGLAGAGGLVVLNGSSHFQAANPAGPIAIPPLVAAGFFIAGVTVAGQTLGHVTFERLDWIGVYAVVAGVLLTLLVAGVSGGTGHQEPSERGQAAAQPVNGRLTAEPGTHVPVVQRPGPGVPADGTPAAARAMLVSGRAPAWLPSGEVAPQGSKLHKWPAVVLLLGLTVSGTSGLVFVLTGSVRQRARMLDRLNRALSREVADHERTTEALRVSEERHRLLMEEAAEAIFTLEDGGRLRSVNARATEMLGRRRDELLEMWYQDLIEAEDVEADPLHWDAVRRGETVRIDRRFRRSDGGTVYAEVSARRVEENLYQVIARDVSQQRQAAEALRQSEARFRGLIEHAMDVIVVLDDKGRSKYLSPGVRQVTGYDPSELLGTDMMDLIHPDDVDNVRKVVWSATEYPGLAPTAELRCRHRDGSWRVLECTVRNLLDEPAVAGLVVNGRDVTSRKELEAQLRHAQRMEAIGRLAGGIAHDFNNVLMVIGGHAELLLDVAQDDEIADGLREILKSSDMASSLTRQLLAFSRKQPMNPYAFSVDEVLEQLEPMLRRLIGEDVALETDYGAFNRVVHADPGHFEQVIMNLVVNAHDAMPQGGTLTLRTRPAALPDDYPNLLADARPGQFVELAVTDTGIGIEPEVLGHIFEPFFTTKEAGKGTGLGLATVYGIVTQSGGYIAAESKPGQGATFRVFLSVPEVEDGMVEPSEDVPTLADV